MYGYDEWDARDQFWDDIEREYEAERAEYADYGEDHDLNPEDLEEENGGLAEYEDIPF